MKWDKQVAVVVGACLLCLFCYNLFRSLPEQHALIMQENAQLKHQLQQRVVTQDPPIPPQVRPPPFDHHPTEDSECNKKLTEKITLVEELQTSIATYRKELENVEMSNVFPPDALPNRPLPLLILCHDRPDYLSRTLDSILANRPSKTQFPIIVSEDGTNESVWKLINGPTYYEHVVGIQLQERGKASTSYHYIAQHFKFAISTVLDKLGFDDVIILEDDMEIGTDFFQYFLRMRELLYEDDSLYTASAWNDNGQGEHGRNQLQLKRSDFFPGLGWMMTGKLWKELGPRWPEGYWDDWMREPQQRQGRHCIFPEISRSWTFGEQGSSGGQFWKEYLKPVKLYSGIPVPFGQMDLSYLELENWKNEIRKRLQETTKISSYTTVDSVVPVSASVLIEYSNDKDYERIAKYFNIMYDEKAGIHRTAFMGVVYFWHKQREVYLVDKDYKTSFDL